MMDNIVNSMLEKFRKLEETLYDVDFDKSELSFCNPSEMTFCNPLTKQKPSGECEFVSETGMELENHDQEKHEQNKENAESGKEQYVNTDKTTETPEDVF